MSDSVVDEITSRLAGVDHETVGEFHRLRASSAKLAGNNNLTSLRVGIHDEAEDTIAGAADGQTTKKLVAEGLALSNGGETTGLNLLCVELECVLGVFETLGEERGELANATSLLSEDFLCVRCANNDL